LRKKVETGYIFAEVTSQKLPEYELDEFAYIAQYNIDFFMTFPLIALFSRMLYKVLVEKEKKIRYFINF